MVTYGLLPRRSVCSVSFLAVRIIVNADIITEGRTFRQGHSSPSPHRERCLLDPLVIPKTPASWPPRHDSTRLRQTCVSGHVASFPPKYRHCPIKDRVVAPVATSSLPSSIVLMSREHEGDVENDFRKAGSYLLRGL